MPRIPLYNQGQGPRVGVESGQLSPRANVGAFTAPGTATMGFQKVFSDIGNVAKDFVIEQQNQEAQRVLYQESIDLGSAATKFITEQNFTKTDDASTAIGNLFAERRENLIQNNPNLNSRQQRFLFNQIQPDILRYTLQSEQKAYNQGRVNNAITTDEFSRSLIQGGKLNDDARKISIALYNQAYDNAEASGFADLLNFNKESFAFELDRESVNLLAQDEATTLEEIDLEIAKIDAGEGKYANYTFDQRQNLINIAGGKQTELESTALMKAEDNQSKALSLIATSGTSVDDNGVDLAANTVAEFRKLGREDLAITLERSVVAGQNVFNTMESLTFGTGQDITEAQEAARQKVFSATRENILEATTEQQLLNEAIINRNERLTNDPAGFVETEYSRKHNGRKPTKAEVIRVQESMGIDLDDVTPFTTAEFTKITSDLTDAQNVDDVVSVFNAMFAEETQFVQEYMMRSLSKKGINPALQLIAANPNLPSNTGLLQSLNKENLTQKSNRNITDSERKIVDRAIFENEDIKDHMLSLMGGSFAGMEGVDSYSSKSDTTEFSEFRAKQSDMIADYIIYLADKDGIIVDNNADLRPYVKDAVKIFTDRFEYIENPGNQNIILRLDKRLPAASSNLQNGMSAELNNLVPMFETFDNQDAIVIYKPPEFSGREGTAVHKEELERYVEETQQFGGWVATNNGQAMLLDRNGGLVFEYKSMGNGDPDEIVPLVRSLSDLDRTGKASALSLRPSFNVNVMVEGPTAGKSGRFTDEELRLAGEKAGLNEARINRYIAGENILTLIREQRESEQ
tara:strand:+ start:493 stop:2898 length:2406 start_codon:yes stop_codon:yes gene_type:complete